MKTLLPGTPVSIVREFRDSPADAYGWRVVEDRGERVLVEAVGLLAGSAVANPQQTVARDMVEEIPAADSVRELTTPAELAERGIDPADFFDGVHFFLASWGDRSGWYSKAEGGNACLVTVGNISEEFETDQAAQNALWALVEVTG